MESSANGSPRFLFGLGGFRGGGVFETVSAAIGMSSLAHH